MTPDEIKALRVGQRIGEATIVEFLDEPNTGLARIEGVRSRQRSSGASSERSKVHQSKRR